MKEKIFTIKIALLYIELYKLHKYEFLRLLFSNNLFDILH
jgi:hypothetical protein